MTVLAVRSINMPSTVARLYQTGIGRIYRRASVDPNHAGEPLVRRDEAYETFSELSAYIRSLEGEIATHASLTAAYRRVLHTYDLLDKVAPTTGFDLAVERQQAELERECNGD